MGMIKRAIIRRNQLLQENTQIPSSDGYTSVGAIRVFAFINLIVGIVLLFVFLFDFSKVAQLGIGMGSIISSPFLFVIAHICDDIKQIKESLQSDE